MTDAIRTYIARRDLVTYRTRKVGAVHLAVGGACNVVVGAALVALSVRGELLGLLIATLPTFVDEVVFVANAPTLRAIALRVAPVAGVGLLAVGFLQVHGGWRAYHARRWSRSVRSAVLMAVNPATLPLAIVAVVLLSLSRDQFSD